MGLDITDKTGTMPSMEDVAEAIEVIQQLLRGVHHLPPELAVQLPNIHRCLSTLRTVYQVHRERQTA